MMSWHQSFLMWVLLGSIYMVSVCTFVVFVMAFDSCLWTSGQLLFYCSGVDLKVWLLTCAYTMLLHVYCSIACSECCSLSLSTYSIVLHIHGKTSLYLCNIEYMCSLFASTWCNPNHLLPLVSYQITQCHHQAL